MPLTTVKSRVHAELKWLETRKYPLALISTTARRGTGFAVTPRRSTLGYDCACFLFEELAAAEAAIPLLDGKVHAILVDIESKQPLDLLTLAQRLAPNTRLLSCKPNDATVESVDHLLQNKLMSDLRSRRVLVYGMGNLGGKIALRLAERGATVLATSRNVEKCATIVEALNLLLPRHALSPIQCLETPEAAGSGSLDAVISCTSGKGVMGMAGAALLRDGALALDVGIDNFSAAFYTAAAERNINIFRLDTRLGFPYLLMPLLGFFGNFFSNICGTATIAEGVRIASGGYVGSRGVVIVDNCSAPTQIVGIANGTGGLLDEPSIGPEERRSISIVKEYVESTAQEALRYLRQPADHPAYLATVGGADATDPDPGRQTGNI